MVTYGHRTVLTISVDVKNLRLLSAGAETSSPGTSDGSGGNRDAENSPGGRSADGRQAGSPGRSRSPRRDVHAEAAGFRTGQADCPEKVGGSRRSRSGSDHAPQVQIRWTTKRMSCELSATITRPAERLYVNAALFHACKMIDRCGGDQMRKSNSCGAELPRRRMIATPCRNGAH